MYKNIVTGKNIAKPMRRLLSVFATDISAILVSPIIGDSAKFSIIVFVSFFIFYT